jgi:hypothetical protein
MIEIGDRQALQAIQSSIGDAYPFGYVAGRVVWPHFKPPYNIIRYMKASSDAPYRNGKMLELY